MKKSELKRLIQECLAEVVHEGKAPQSTADFMEIEHKVDNIRRIVSELITKYDDHAIEKIVSAVFRGGIGQDDLEKAIKNIERHCAIAREMDRGAENRGWTRD